MQLVEERSLRFGDGGGAAHYVSANEEPMDFAEEGGLFGEGLAVWRG